MASENSNISALLNPSGHVLLQGLETPGIDSEDWAGRLFYLAARKVNTITSPAARYWQEFAERYLTHLCHIPEEQENFRIDPPSESECSSLLLTAPPMAGGEYLSHDVLNDVWAKMENWVEHHAQASGGLHAFLNEYAPKWRQVGRVCFHLAENKAQPERPFAFMATYAAGLNKQGHVRHQPLGRALEEYAGQRNREALVRLLSPVDRASQKCEWLKELVDSGRIYRPLAWTPSQAYRLLTSAEELQEAGLSLRLPDWWKKRPRPRVEVTVGKRKDGNFSASSLMSFDMELAIGDVSLSKEDWETLEQSEDGLVLVKGQWVEVDGERLRQAREHWERLESEGLNEGVDFVRAMRLLAGASEDLRHEDDIDEERSWTFVKAGGELKALLERLREPENIGQDKTPSQLCAKLRPYQEKGLAWLHLLTGMGLGACLADDMGLGKTIQILALLLKQKYADKGASDLPSLLVVPASLLANWKSEAEKFAPSLRLLFIHPSETQRQILKDIAENPEIHLKDVDLVVTTYSMLYRQDWLLERQWRNAILDEAQAIKTPTTRKTRAAKKLNAVSRIALTGTPVENQLGDLWSLFDFLNPGLLGGQKVFQDFVKQLENRRKDHYAPLRKLTAPYILRRLKTDRRIIKDLPEKTETDVFCNLAPKQAKLYQQVVDALKTTLDQQSEGIARRGAVLQALMRLKQICNHPSQLTGDKSYKPSDSGKFKRLAAICEEIAQRQEKVLIFSQFREIIDPLEDFLSRSFGHSGLTLHGGTSVKKRKTIVDAFQSETGPPFMILSLKAGGTGLNLTAASHVVHFDRWWNPSVENQATDRAFRIGQKRNVLVHKFIVQGTVEEHIDEMIRGKQELAEKVLGGEEKIKWTEMSNEEILKLVRLDVSRARW